MKPEDRGRRDPESPLDPEDRVFVERLAASYAPPPLSPAKRAAFDAALEARLTRRPWRLAPALAGAALALALAWIILPGLAPESPPRTALAAGPSAAEWEYQLLDIDTEAAETGDDGDGLPDDYLAIASVFLDG